MQPSFASECVVLFGGAEKNIRARASITQSSQHRQDDP